MMLIIFFMKHDVVNHVSAMSTRLLLFGFCDEILKIQGTLSQTKLNW